MEQACNERAEHTCAWPPRGCTLHAHLLVHRLGVLDPKHAGVESSHDCCLEEAGVGGARVGGQPHPKAVIVACMQVRHGHPKRSDVGTHPMAGRTCKGAAWPGSK